MKLFLVVVAAGLVLAVSSLATGEEDCPVLCGKQGGGLLCPDNQCCSEDGKCGFGDDHCGENCQSGPCQPDRKQRCGRDFGNKKCTNNYCCSADGYCGFGMSYCGNGQFPRSKPPPTPGCQSGFCMNTPCSEKNQCSNNQCCSPGGYCGVGVFHCGLGCKGGPCYPRDVIVAGNATGAQESDDVLPLTGPPTPTPPSKCQHLCGRLKGGLECPDNKCCSKDGKCGFGDDHCDVGCQGGPCYPSRKQRCGGAFGGRKCTNNYCCSIGGFCGVGLEYCTALPNNFGCQINYGVCYIGHGIPGGFPVDPRETPPTDKVCVSDRSCRNNFCCGGYYCGLGDVYCGDRCISGPCYYTSSAAIAANASTLQVS